jgi:hypothetical protein
VATPWPASARAADPLSVERDLVDPHLRRLPGHARAAGWARGRYAQGRPATPLETGENATKILLTCLRAMGLPQTTFGKGSMTNEVLTSLLNP